MIVYLIRNRVNGKVYIGKTVLPLAARWRDHSKPSKLRNPKMVLTRAIAKHGVDAFDVSVLVDNIATEDEMNRIERDMIAQYRSHEKSIGYNTALGGEGHTMGPEARKAVSDRLLANHPMRGKHLSDDQKAKLSVAFTGEKNHQFGKRGPLSAKYGVPCPEHVKEGMRQQRKGVARKPEHLANIRAAAAMPERRAAISESKKKYYAENPHALAERAVLMRAENQRRAEQGIRYNVKPIPDIEDAARRVNSGETIKHVADSIGQHCVTLKRRLLESGLCPLIGQNICHRCNKPFIPGIKGKRFCSLSDDAQCYSARRRGVKGQDRMSRTNGCNGSCCAGFPINNYTIEEWNEYLEKRQDSQDSELEKIAAMVIHIGAGELGEAIFTCRHFDADSKLCMDYENRPRLCSDYPYAGGHACGHCNLTLTQINGLEITGGFGHEPFKMVVQPEEQVQ